MSERTCAYCRKPAGTPVARQRPGDPSSPLVGVSHPKCYGEFLANLVLVLGAGERT